VAHTRVNPDSFRDPLSLAEGRFWLATGAMVLGNLLLPLALHQIPDGGRMFQPIFFFTLVAGWRFGAQAGLLTALVSPLANHFLTGLPPFALVPDLVLQSALLGALASLAAVRHPRPTVALLALVVFLHQLLCLPAATITAGGKACLDLVRLHLPGIVLQVLGGCVVLRGLARYRRPSPNREG